MQEKGAVVGGEPDAAGPPSPIPSLLFATWMALAVALAGVFRLTALDSRPMHGDEANQALKFGQVLDDGRYRYDPQEHHGPSLAFLTLPAARLGSARTLAEVTERHLRVVPALFGVGLVLLVWLVRRPLGHAAACWAGTLTAVSGAMVFYSRYYIQEMILVFFSFGAIVALWRYTQLAEAAARVRRGFWLAALGVSLGMMHATKETCVVPMFALGVAAAASLGRSRRRGRIRTAISVSLVLLTAVVTSALFFSSFFKTPEGVADSVTAYVHYLRRAPGQGSVAEHRHPVDYYFRLLFWWHQPGGRFWSEAAVLALGLVGLAAAAGRRPPGTTRLHAARFLAVYTVLMAAIYSLIPYKTPWCALGMLHGWILLAGLGAAALVRRAPGPVGQSLAVGLLLAATGHLGWQAYQASFVVDEDPTNPYAYAPTTRDVLRLTDRVRRVVQRAPDATGTAVQVICPDHDYWPLPWYFRRLPRVGWYDRPPQGPPAPIIITQPSMAGRVKNHIYLQQPPGQRPLYVPVPPEPDGPDWQLRPGVPLLLWIQWDVWQRVQTIPPGAHPSRDSLPFTGQARSLR